MDAKQIVRRFSALESNRKVAEQAWELIERFIYPIGGGKFFEPLSTEGEMQWRRRGIFDDTAILGADTLAASIHGSLTSPATKWFDFAYRSPDLNLDNEAKAWLDKAASITWDTIQQSNFNLEISESYLDLTSFGNAAITQEPIDDLVWKGTRFNAMPLREAYFEEDSKNQPRNFYRLLHWTPSQIVDKFGIENVPDKVKEKYESTSVSEREEVIFCIYTSDENIDADTSGVLAKDKRPYQYKYVLRNGMEILGEGGYYEKPAYFLRWRRAPGSEWGYGPGHIALSTTITLNELIKLVLEAAEKVIDPVSLINQRALLSDLNLEPGGQVVVKDVDKAIKAYESGARFDVSSLQVNDLRMMIRRLFHVDQLELKESPAMSATEVMVRYELMNRLLGPTMGRLQNDLLDPLVTNTFKMLYRAKQFPPPPEIIAKLGGDINVEYVGPLSRAQKSDEVASVERWLQGIAGLAEFLPEMRHVPDPVAIGKYMANGLNVPAGLMNSDAKITTAIADDKKAMATAQAQQEEQNQADIAATQGEEGGAV